jgi:hypothetical protein
MSETVKIIYGAPFAGAVSSPFLEVLEKYAVKDLDTGGSYVSWLPSFRGFH